MSEAVAGRFRLLFGDRRSCVCRSGGPTANGPEDVAAAAAAADAEAVAPTFAPATANCLAKVRGDMQGLGKCKDDD